MTAQLIESTVQNWEREPARAFGTPSVKARSAGPQAVLEAGSFSWRADLPPSLGGGNQAPSPTALLLSALAGCAVVFIKDTLAPQLGVRVDAVHATASCETDSRGLLGMEGARPDLDNLKLELQIETPAGQEDVQRLMDVWQERCPVYLALAKPNRVELSYTTLNWYAVK